MKAPKGITTTRQRKQAQLKSLPTLDLVKIAGGDDPIINNFDDPIINN